VSGLSSDRRSGPRSPGLHPELYRPSQPVGDRSKLIEE
jgi:hypothetical protein